VAEVPSSNTARVQHEGQSIHQITQCLHHIYLFWKNTAVMVCFTKCSDR